MERNDNCKKMNKYHIRVELYETAKRKLPKGGNARQHWTAKYSEIKRWKNAAIEAIGDKIPKAPLEKVRLRFTRYSRGADRMDWDNLVISFKHVQDALVEAGILANDTRDNIPNMPIYETGYAKAKSGKIVIELWEI